MGKRVRAKPVRAEQFIYTPDKMQPWSSLSLLGGTLTLTGPDGSPGFIPVFATRETAQQEFPDDTIREWRIPAPEAPKPKRRGKARGARGR